jgi:regulator of RNase E activity RraA
VSGTLDHRGEAAPHDEAIRRRYLAVDTSNVADALDEAGHRDQGLSAEFAPRPAGAGRLAGWAFTILGAMAPPPDGAGPVNGDARKMAACGDVTAGEVTVWTGACEGVCCFGELIALGLQERGCVGALVDGGVRDVRWLGEHGFPVYARYRTPVQSIGRWRVTDWQVPVVLPGATSRHVLVTPGDLILADDDGALVVPRALAEPVLLRAEELTATEARIRAELAGGMTLREALTRFGHV